MEDLSPRRREEEPRKEPGLGAAFLAILAFLAVTAIVCALVYALIAAIGSFDTGARPQKTQPPAVPAPVEPQR